MAEELDPMTRANLFCAVTATQIAAQLAVIVTEAIQPPTEQREQLAHLLQLMSLAQRQGGDVARANEYAELARRVEPR